VFGHYGEGKMPRILSISYDSMLLKTRELLLQQMGYEVISAEGFSVAYQVCDAHGHTVDLIVLGHSIPHDDKIEIVKRCTDTCSCPVLALLRANEGPVKGAARSIESGEPKAFIQAVEDILRERHQLKPSTHV
jgi:CheY-like chemotaxis protein